MIPIGLKSSKPFGSGTAVSNASQVGCVVLSIFSDGSSFALIHFDHAALVDRARLCVLMLPIRIGPPSQPACPSVEKLPMVDQPASVTKFLTVPLLLTLADVDVLVLQLFFGRYMYRLLMDVPLLLTAALASVPCLR